MKTIADNLTEKILDNNTIFVFPTQVAADSWAEKTLEVTGCGSVALERFIAWDRFKESSVKSRVTHKKSVSSAVRNLYAHTLLVQNAHNPFFESLVPPRFARDFSPFTSWLSRLLPSLALFKRALAERELRDCDAEERDLLVLEQKYALFLQENSLFEPAWEVPPFESNGKTYLIFYPEVIEDFDEYARLLNNSPHVNIISASHEYNPPPHLERFQNTRQELAFLAQSILRDHLEDGVSLDRIAVSVPGLETIEPYLQRELRLHDIAFQLRAAKPLCGYPAGSLFTLMQECVQSCFALEALKRLLTQSVFPWRFPNLNTLLIDFGSEHRCGCALQNTDLWLDAFNANPSEERLKTYYENLRLSIESAVNAKTFTQLRTAYFTFRTRFFDTELFTTQPERFSAQTDAVMARCIEELGALIEVEREFPDLAAVLTRCGESSPCAFFTTTLSQKQYLSREQGRGVNIFAYKAAACAPFERHYLINASQSDASVVVGPLSFLASGKRRKLGITDKNISQYFFLLYQAGSDKTVFSCAEKTFTGYACVHGWFLTRGTHSPQDGQKQDRAQNQAASQSRQTDAWLSERDWWANPALSDFPPQIFSLQKTGFLEHAQKETGTEALKRAKTAREYAEKQSETFSATRGQEPDSAAQLIYERIRLKKSREGTFTITASDMNAFTECKIRWLYERIFGIADPRTADELIDSLTLGSYYHAVIADVLRAIKESGKTLDPNENDTYCTLVEQAARRQTENRKLFADYLPRLVMQSALENAVQTLQDFFIFLSRAFAGSTVAETEKKYTVPFADGSELTGNIDCLLYLNDGWCLLDFKKNSLPQLAKYRDVPQNPLKDFQLPLYKRLFEQTSSKPGAVTQAAFVSIENSAKRFAAVLGNNPSSARSRSLYATCEEFEPVMSAFEQTALQYYKTISVQNPTLASEAAAFDVCVQCPFNSLCRTTYYVSGESNAL